MIALFGQVWILCVIAFLAGSAVTWLLFVRTPRRRHAPPRRHTKAPPAPERAPSLPRRPRPARPEEPPPPVEPALANLDTRGREATSRRSGSSAAGALDRLGVAGAPHRPEDGPVPPQIPAQGGPVDEPAGGDR
jgi:hypothetical protein